MRGVIVLAAVLSLWTRSVWAVDPAIDAVSGADVNDQPDKDRSTGTVITDFLKDLQDRLIKLGQGKDKEQDPGDGLMAPGSMTPALIRELDAAKKELESLKGMGLGPQGAPMGDQTAQNPRTAHLTPEQRRLLIQAINGTVPGFEGRTVYPSPPQKAKGGTVAGPPPSKPEDHQRRADAFKTASKLGDQLKTSFGSGDDLSGPDQGTSSTGGDGAKPGATSILSPKSKSELLLASVSGFGGSFEASGLQVKNAAGSQPEILRKDGTPANEQDLAALSAHIESEPTALMRRPDYFTVLPREKFQTLKQEYDEKPALRDAQFKHIANTGRDFQRSQSCEKLSGGCNAFAQKSYRKGEDVPPEDLSSIHNDLMEHHAFDPDAAEKDEASAAAAQARGIGRAGVKSIYSRLNFVIAGVQSFFGMGGSSSAGPALASAIGFPSPTHGVALPVKFSQPRKLGQANAPRALSAAADPPPLELPQRRSLQLLAGGFMLVILGLLLMRR